MYKLYSKACYYMLMTLAVVVALPRVAARSIRVRKKLMILLKKWKNLPQNQTFRRLLSLSLVCLICI